MESKLKVLSIVPYEGMRAVINSLSEQYPTLQIDAYVGNIEGAARLARTHFYADSYDVILSRGGTADMLKQDGFPVIEIEISLYDILYALRLANGIAGKLAMVVYANIAINAQILCDLLGCQIEIFSVKSLSELKPTLRSLKEQGYRTVLCDTVANNIARRLGLNAILVTSGVDSIRQALNVAQLLCSVQKRLQAASHFYRDVLRSQPGQTIVLDETGAVIFHSADTVAEDLLAELRRELPDAFTTDLRRIARSINGHTQFIRIQSMDVTGHIYTVFSIEPRKISSRPGQFGIRFIPQREAESALYDSVFGFAGIINEYRADISRAETGTAPVLLTGEDGTGKEQIVHALYLNGPYHISPLVSINCSVLSSKSWTFLMEHHNSPLTDIRTTIYFSNIDTLSASRRKQLIEILLELNVCRNNFVLFSGIAYPDGRITLEGAEFLNSLHCQSIYLKPLRLMKSNFNTLVSLTLNHLNIDQPYPILGAAPDSIRLLQAFSWPHNYTQFFRVIRELVSTATGQAITATEVQNVLQKERYFGSFTPLADNTTAPLNLNRTLTEINRDIAFRVLHETGDNQTVAAKHLGISRTTLWRLLRTSDAVTDESEASQPIRSTAAPAPQLIAETKDGSGMLV